MRLGPRQSAIALCLLVAGLFPPVAAQAEDPVAPPPAAEAVGATVDVERVLLREDLERHSAIAAERTRVAGRLAELYGELDVALKRTDAQAHKAVEDARARLAPVESDRAEILAGEQALLERILERQRRIRLLDERLTSLQDRVSEEAGPLAGRWDVVFLPAQQKGTFALVQTGTLISGTYSLDGGWTGSLQGTLVNRKVHLERIDSKLGRSAEFEGYLSVDGQRMRGTWRSYELSAQDPASGHWSATRKAATGL